MIPEMILSQKDIDCAYAVKVFLDYHPNRSIPIDTLASECAISEQRLKSAFLKQFSIQLDEYWVKMQRRHNPVMTPLKDNI